ncbi:uncharacterized protein YALI1_F16366g [Yarrowia lipolytica]|uniref:Secreted protein n=1 Tax=Yarrowia lipolytica TaxID=4952 RepID=A0A1D8NN45_YARLL|nr:hypothetical protein YALI1_F16366g [Yarrowia lipolytica]
MVLWLVFLALLRSRATKSPTLAVSFTQSRCRLLAPLLHRVVSLCALADVTVGALVTWDARPSPNCVRRASISALNCLWVLLGHCFPMLSFNLSFHPVLLASLPSGQCGLRECDRHWCIWRVR